MARSEIRVRGKTARKPEVDRHLNYPGAGHIVLGIPYARPVLETRGARGALIDLGGTAAANEAAHERDWRATIDFVTRH
jgi:BAAT / Acyl-CoA thioester hydrolase C terminal